MYKCISSISILVLCMIVIVIFTESGKTNKNNNRLFEIVDIKPGHVVEVTFQDVNTAELYKINFIKRHCANWTFITLGSEWSLPVLIKNENKYIINANLICGE